MKTVQRFVHARFRTMTTCLIMALASFFIFILFDDQTAVAATAAQVTSPYLYNFNSAGVLQEASDSVNSTSPYWWVNSGAYLKMYGYTGHTNQGDLPASDPWRILYSVNNPTDTDNGRHPQNIFRLFTRSKWQNVQETAYFMINANNLSSSPNRNSSNGLLFFGRYQDNGDLYYAGIRVDGAAVIKKKRGGAYYTLVLAPGVYPGLYNSSTNPNLIGKNTWIGLRVKISNNLDGSVHIVLSLDKTGKGLWQTVVDTTDTGQNGLPITQAGYMGIRTDFMDVTFENFSLTNL